MVYINYFQSNIDNKLFLFKDHSAFGQFLKETHIMPPEERAEYLKTDIKITNAHQESAQEGQTEVWIYFMKFKIVK